MQGVSLKDSEGLSEAAAGFSGSIADQSSEQRDMNKEIDTMFKMEEEKKTMSKNKKMSKKGSKGPGRPKLHKGLNSKDYK
mmetsp:Transcript_22853/g.22696  ORF Transcript_22853/g.22696 Transcript_22853/m.22696 type:complete len:80 (-) Transcript_22853:578-817(-)